MDEEILKKLKETLSNALGVEEDEVELSSSLVKDLGAESIDFIDIIFRLEKTFDLKIPSGDLFPGNLLNEERFVQGGVVTEEGLEELKTKVPYLDIESFKADPQVSKLADHFTVQMVANYIKDRLTKDAKA